VTSTYEFRLSDAGEDPEWDLFVERMPGGNHVQTSLWGQVKAEVDMRAVRVTATRGGSIVGGGQILLGTVPVVGTVAYVPRGPLVMRDHHDVSTLLIDQIRSAAFDHGARHITIQPPIDGFDLEPVIVASGFRSTPNTVVPPATVVVDLTPPIETILARMHKKTRYNIRLAERRGLTVREGGAQDLEAYFSMVEATASRQDFDPYPREYYRTMWKVLEPRGFLRFTIVEYDGAPVASMFAVPFGDRTINKLPAWSGEYGGHHPNELLHWDTIRWSKENGFDFYDFEGVAIEVARNATEEGTIPQHLSRGVTRFKIGFGGEPRLLPGAYFDASNMALRWAYGAAMPKLVAWKPAKKVIERLRTRPSATEK
jgi:peptidoglycan pentaglycine glycine transferase (the first glycine)